MINIRNSSMKGNSSMKTCPNCGTKLTTPYLVVKKAKKFITVYQHDEKGELLTGVCGIESYRSGVPVLHGEYNAKKGVLRYCVAEVNDIAIAEAKRLYSVYIKAVDYE